MAIAKKAETEIKAAETAAAPVEEKAAEKKAPAKKAPAKKAAAKKEAAPKAAKKVAENVYVEYQGVQLNSASLIERAKKESGVKSPKSVNVYVKPEDNKVYYVVDNNAGDFSLVD
jgi:membrane protein involved in colicin uptake